MLRLLIALAASCMATIAQPAPTVEQIKDIEQSLGGWLADPQEFGVAPTRLKYLTSVATKAPGGAAADVHIVEYVMPDGTYGKGFVNPVTFSFGPLPYEKLTDSQLVTAYTGMLLLVGGLDSKTVVKEFQPKTWPQLTKELTGKGWRNIAVKEKYRIGNGEVFEFEATKAGKKFKGAGQVGLALIYEAGSPEASLPIIYTFLGKVQRQEF